MIVVHHLNHSRSQRVLWLLEELGVPYRIERYERDPKTMLQEWAQSQGFQAPQYVTRSATGPDHSKMFAVDVLILGDVKGSGLGHSKQAAAKAAAQNALQQLGLVD